MISLSTVRKELSINPWHQTHASVSIAPIRMRRSEPLSWDTLLHSLVPRRSTHCVKECTVTLRFSALILTSPIRLQDLHNQARHVSLVRIKLKRWIRLQKHILRISVSHRINPACLHMRKKSLHLEEKFLFWRVTKVQSSLISRLPLWLATAGLEVFRSDCGTNYLAYMQRRRYGT